MSGMLAGTKGRARSSLDKAPAGRLDAGRTREVVHASGATVEDTGDAGGSGAERYAATDAEGSAGHSASARTRWRGRGRGTTGRTRHEPRRRRRDRRSRAGPSTLDVLADASGYRPADVVTALPRAPVVRTGHRFGNRGRKAVWSACADGSTSASARTSADGPGTSCPGSRGRCPRTRGWSGPSRWSARTPWPLALRPVVGQEQADRQGPSPRGLARAASSVVASGRRGRSRAGRVWPGPRPKEGWKNRGLRGLEPNGAKTRAKLFRDAARKREWRAGEGEAQSGQDWRLALSPSVAPSETKPVRVASVGRRPDARRTKCV